MYLSELEQLSLGELEQLTILDLESDVLDILKRYRNSELPLTPKLVKKLTDMSGLFPESERPKFFNVKTVANALALINHLIDFCRKTELDAFIRNTLSSFVQDIVNMIKGLS